MIKLELTSYQAKKRDDVLYAFAVEEGNPSTEILNKYVFDHPEYVWELIELFQELVKPVEDNDLTPEDEKLIDKAYSKFSDNHFDEEYR
jgi:hypothetical protein